MEPGLPEINVLRREELQWLFRRVQAGESAACVGVSGVGKSNLFRLLLDPDVQRRYLGEAAGQYLFVRANFHALPDPSARSICSLIVEQLELLLAPPGESPADGGPLQRIQTYHQALLDAGDDLLKVQHYFKLAVQAALGDPRLHLVLLFDQFDKVFREAEPAVFLNLRGLREDYKYRLSFLVFTRLRLPQLVHLDPEREEFHELFAPNLLWLRPYGREDALRMLARIASRHAVPLDEGAVEQLYGLCGGHAGLLRVTFLEGLAGGISLPAGPEALRRLLQDPAVELECAKIWDSLGLEEKRAVYRLSQDIPLDDERAAVQHLEARGLVDPEGQIFSPLFAAYVAAQQPVWEKPFHLDLDTRQVSVLGKAKPPLTSKEFTICQCLFERAGEVVTREELIQVGWPGEDHRGISEQALDAVMSRLRKKIEPDPKNPRFLVTLRDQGFVLQIE